MKNKALHQEKVIVWCAFWCEGGIERYFFENDDRTTVTVNSERYGHMITALFFVCYGRI